MGSKMTWTAYVQQDGDDLILPLPDELMDQMGWKTGEILVWEIDEESGTITLRKKPTWYNILWSKIRKWNKRKDEVSSKG